MANPADRIFIINRAHEGYRRAGVAFQKGVNELSAGLFTADQLAAIEADPRLSIGSIDPKTDPAKVAPGTLDKAGVGDAVTETEKPKTTKAKGKGKAKSGKAQ